jgi:hypothetical protein
VTNEGEGQNDLAQPRFGNRKIKQDIVIFSGGSKKPCPMRYEPEQRPVFPSKNEPEAAI